MTIANPETIAAALPLDDLRERVVNSRCPVCNDMGSVDYESVEVDIGSAYQRADCGTCGLTWWEHYELTHVSHADPVDDKQETWRRVHEPTAALLKLAQGIVSCVDNGKPWADCDPTDLLECLEAFTEEAREAIKAAGA